MALFDYGGLMVANVRKIVEGRGWPEPDRVLGLVRAFEAGEFTAEDARVQFEEASALLEEARFMRRAVVASRLAEGATHAAIAGELGVGRGAVSVL